MFATSEHFGSVLLGPGFDLNSIQDSDSAAQGGGLFAR